MPRWLEITLTLVLFTAGMAVLSWAVKATVPGFDRWLSGWAGEGGAWALFLLLMAICAYFAWRGHRPTSGRRGRLDGT